MAADDQAAAELAEIRRTFDTVVARWDVDDLNAERRRLQRKGTRRDAVDEQLLAAINAALFDRMERGS